MWLVTVILKYFNFATFSKIYCVFIVWFYCTFWSRGIKMSVYALHFLRIYFYTCIVSNAYQSFFSSAFSFSSNTLTST
jgi:hypothetical protein